AMAQFADKDAVLAMDDPGAEIPYLQAAWRYARGEAMARAGDSDAARAEAEEIGKLLAEADFSPLVDGNVPAPDILNIARLVVIGRAAMAEGDLGTAIEALEEAAAIQETLVYMEPPYWYYPVKQTLGAALLKNGEADRAEQLFLQTLGENPNNGWVLYGLSETYAALGDKNGAKLASGLMKDAWAGDRKAVTLDRL
ncbi:MAG: tetratricopeptide repeat protein, partial [Pseudomonadota bacterium]